MKILFHPFGRNIPKRFKYFYEILQMKNFFHPFGRDLPKIFSLKYFCILIISFKKVAEKKDSNDDVESDMIFQKILSIQR